MKDKKKTKPEIFPNTFVYKLIKTNKIFSNVFFKILLTIISFLGLASAFVIVYSLFGEIVSKEILFSLHIVLSFALSILSYYFYIKSGSTNLVERGDLKKAKEKVSNQEINIVDLASINLGQIIYSFVGNKEVLIKDLLTELLKTKDLIFVTNRLGLGSKTIVGVLKDYPKKYDILPILTRALDIAILENHKQIEVGDFFIALCEKDELMQKILKEIGLEVQDLINIVYWQTKVFSAIAKRKNIFDPDKLKLTGGVGKDWVFGWTPNLNRFSYDLSRYVQAQGLNFEIIGHEKEHKQIIEALTRQQGGNVIVVGEPGIGKNTSVIGLVKKINEGATNSSLDFKHVLKIDINSLISGLTGPGEFTQRISYILHEAASAGNIIVYIEDIEKILSSGDAGKVDATEVLVPFLNAAEMRIVATIDVSGYNKLIRSNSVLNQRFSRVSIEEPTDKEMIRILEDVVPSIEYDSKAFVSYEAIKETIKTADKYIVNVPNPEKSINLLDGAVAKATSERGKTIILAKDIDDYVTEKYEVPAGDVEEGEKKKLLNLEKIMHESIVGQNKAISALSNAMRRARAGISNSKKPIGSFLFLGPTGVGKTETAKALARAYFGSENKIVRFDMSEYQNKEDIYRLIGSNLGGGEEQGLLTTSVREKPFSLLLFDEIEKAHRDILDLFLQILDEGFITDGSGRKVSFANNIIISTSNAGSGLIRETIKNGVEYDSVKKELIDYLQKENIYRPEFLNRFSGVIVFSPLSEDEIADIAELMIEELKQNLVKNKGVSFSLTPDAVTVLARLGYNPEMGARPMARVIQEKVENYLAQKILSGELKKGDSITLNAESIN